MPHIHTQPGQHDHTVGAYIIRTDSGEPKLMLHLHKKIGKYLQFGGHIELNETPWQAVAHELAEESGYQLEELRLLQPHHRIMTLTDATIHPVPISHSTHRFGGTSDHFHTDAAYAFTVDHAPTNTPDEGESTDIRLFTRSELMRLTPDETPVNVKEIGVFIFDHILAEWEVTDPRAYH